MSGGRGRKQLSSTSNRSDYIPIPGAPAAGITRHPSSTKSNAYKAIDAAVAGAINDEDEGTQDHLTPSLDNENIFSTSWDSLTTVAGSVKKMVAATVGSLKDQISEAIQPPLPHISVQDTDDIIEEEEEEEEEIIIAPREKEKLLSGTSKKLHASQSLHASPTDRSSSSWASSARPTDTLLITKANGPAAPQTVKSWTDHAFETYRQMTDRVQNFIDAEDERTEEVAQLRKASFGNSFTEDELSRLEPLFAPQQIIDSNPPKKRRSSAPPKVTEPLIIETASTSSSDESTTSSDPISPLLPPVIKHIAAELPILSPVEIHVPEQKNAFYRTVVQPFIAAAQYTKDHPIAVIIGFIAAIPGGIYSFCMYNKIDPQNLVEAVTNMTAGELIFSIINAFSSIAVNTPMNAWFLAGVRKDFSDSFNEASKGPWQKAFIVIAIITGLAVFFASYGIGFSSGAWLPAAKYLSHALGFLNGLIAFSGRFNSIIQFILRLTEQVAALREKINAVRNPDAQLKKDILAKLQELRDTFKQELHNSNFFADKPIDEVTLYELFKTIDLKLNDGENILQQPASSGMADLILEISTTLSKLAFAALISVPAFDTFALKGFSGFNEIIKLFAGFAQSDFSLDSIKDVGQRIGIGALPGAASSLFYGIHMFDLLNILKQVKAYFAKNPEKTVENTAHLVTIVATCVFSGTSMYNIASNLYKSGSAADQTKIWMNAAAGFFVNMKVILRKAYPAPEAPAQAATPAKTAMRDNVVPTDINADFRKSLDQNEFPELMEGIQAALAKATADAQSDDDKKAIIQIVVRMALQRAERDFPELADIMQNALACLNKTEQTKNDDKVIIQALDLAIEAQANPDMISRLLSHFKRHDLSAETLAAFKDLNMFKNEKPKDDTAIPTIKHDIAGI